MHSNYSSLAAKQALFHTELVRYGIAYDKAAIVAKILAEAKPDEQLTPEEIQLTRDVCNEWSKRHQRLSRLLAKPDSSTVSPAAGSPFSEQTAGSIPSYSYRSGSAS